MNYIDLHSDALTKTEGVFQVSADLLRRGGCILQCFAVFLSDPLRAFMRTAEFAERFGGMCAREGYRAVRTASDLKARGMKALLTVEGGEAIEGELSNLDALFSYGVRMMTLTWNRPNALGYPNMTDFRSLSFGHGMDVNRRETERGLTPLGWETVERMGELGMAVDVSHGSDRLFSDVAAWSKRTGIPFLASHSDADAVFHRARNLTDDQLVLLAECGGVVGLNFYADFLSGERTVLGQREAVLAHARHIVRVAGEDVLALGSDFDGIPANPYLPDASFVPRLLKDLSAEFGERVAEKIAFWNALRFLGDVLPPRRAKLRAEPVL